MSCCCCGATVLIPLAIIAGFLYKYFCCCKKAELKQKEYKKDVVYLYQFKRLQGLPNLSPFCVKVESFLRVHKIKYESFEDNMKYRSQKGLLPFIELNGEQIADSELIIEHLTKHFNIKENVSKQDAAASRAFSRMFDEEVFRIHLLFKAKSEGFMKELAPFIPGFIFPLLKPVITYMIRSRAGGHAKLTESEAKQIYRRDLQAFSDYLGDKKFIGGNEPSIGDYSVFGQLAAIYCLPYQMEVNPIIDDFPSIKKFMATMYREYFSDFDMANRLKE